MSRLSREALLDFAETYGDAARLTIGTGHLDELTLENGYFDEVARERLVSDAARVDATYRIVITVDKAQLAARLLAGAQGVLAHLFFFQQGLDSHLARPPSDVERELWEDPEKRLILIVLEEPTLMTGTCLSVVNADPDAIAAEVAKPIPEGFRRMALRRNDYIGWDTSLATGLTPMHFERAEREAWKLGARLDRLALGLAAMFLCDRARDVRRPDGGSFTQAEFRGREHVAFVPIHWTPSQSWDVEPQGLDAVLRVVAWCYEPIPEHRGTDMVADRLPLVQTRIAQLLESRPEQERLLIFGHVMPSIAEGVKWHWRSFIEGRVAEYLDHVRDLESVTGQTVERLAEDTSSVVKRLTETSLAAVAALIGSFIAATFRDPFQADLFRIGMLSYAGYVLLFPLGIGLSSSVGDARLAFSGFEAQRATLREVLGEDRVRDIVGNRPESARRRFRFWAWMVAALYVVAISATAIAALIIPGLVES